ncbi:hypothetical protein BDN72DRAFT_812561 [Pluteus cervinus]|uniref:Uncharacterized protein n=1 Tax=Pluteus cervinus TaxID=181527 RepID=A0ACD3B8J9_9AGAR|nr:hypothetical protein BDN72DRAFT_812561 [Pluteus cervinus]
MLEMPTTVLTIAGSDSSGGAGIQADLKTFAALDCYGCSAVTALTAQNTLGVQGVHPTPPAFLEQQIQSIFEDLDVHAIKTGMLYDTENTRAVVRTLRTFMKPDPDNPVRQSIPLVCDPVCVSTSGHTLLDPTAVSVLIEELFPISTLITPNKSEAELLLRHRELPADIRNLDDMLVASKNLLIFGSKGVLLKGGHLITTTSEVTQFSTAHPDITVISQGMLDENMEILKVGALPEPTELVADVLSISSGSTILFVRPRIDSNSTHGTGCTLSAALTCELAKGQSLEEATRLASIFTYSSISTAQSIGRGHGPLNHLHGISRRCVSLPTKSNPYPLTHYLIRSNAKAWKDYVEHAFVRQLGEGTLPQGYFVHFIKQDYFYLKYYARAYALLAAKSTTFSGIQDATKSVLSILHETGMHKQFCAQYGVSEEELESTPEDAATTAYGAYLIDVGLQGDTTKLLMSLLSCLLGYGEVGLWLKKEAEREGSLIRIEGNPYKKWIEDYSGKDFQAAVKFGLDAIETRAVDDPPSSKRLEEWRVVWEKCTLFEKGFWDNAMGRD